MLAKFRSATEPRLANASSTSTSSRLNRRSGSVVPTPITPRTSPHHVMGATIAAVNPSYAGCGGSTSS